MIRTAMRVGLILLFVVQIATQLSAQSVDESLKKALLFFSPFDADTTATVGNGDKRIWQAPSLERRDSAQASFPSNSNIEHRQNGGRFGGHLRFNKESGPIVFYRVEGNFPAPATNWQSTVSCWLKADTKGELKDGFCDPIQITSKQWDDAAFFIEFEKRATDIPFRLGVYADKQVWNPTGRKFETIPANERPLITVANSPFESGNWTHVAFTFEGFNQEGSRGKAVLYLNGVPSGELIGRPQVFTWDIKNAAIMLGLNFVGGMDELATFHRALSADEVKTLFQLNRGLAGLGQSAN